MMRTMTAGASDASFQEKNFYEYHLYTLPRPVTLHDNQVKQIALIDPATTPVAKAYTFDGWRGGKDVRVSLEFTNSEANHLGMPLPAGKVRLYKSDTDGSLQFIGEDRIDHTPRNEKVTLQTGNAFDITADRNRTDYKRLSNTTHEESYSVELHNRKEGPVTVLVRDRFGGDWKVTEQSQKGKKVDASTNEWAVKLPANGEVTLTYTVRVN